MIEIKQQKNKTYQFRLKTPGGQTLLKSIDFNSREEIELTVQRLTPLANDYNIIERKTNYDGNFVFNLKDASGKVIGKSLLYNSEAGMENGINNLKRSIRSLTKPGG
ncbi:MAG: YegP family protein [Flavobacteriaceae bacterium]